MKQGLPLFRATGEVAAPAVLAQLRNMPTNGAPTLDLTLVIRATPTKVVTAIPLKPAARVFVINPPLLAPNRERLGGVDLKKVEFRVMTVGTEFGSKKPVAGELCRTVSHISAAEDTELEHLFWRQLWPETGGKVLSGRFCEEILITALHPIVDLDPDRFHASSCSRPGLTAALIVKLRPAMGEDRHSTPDGVEQFLRKVSND